MKKVIVTGAKGTVGGAVVRELDPSNFDVVPLDLPEYDVSDLDSLVEATKGAQALVHMAWAAAHDNDGASPAEFLESNFTNSRMGINAYEAARVNGIPRVIMASSNHAHRHSLRDSDGRIHPTSFPAEPDSVYGAEKLFLENVGRYYSTEYGLGVVCLRIGNVNKEDQPRPPSFPEDAVRWLSFRDLGQLTTKILLAPEIPDGFQVIHAMSQQDIFDLSNPFGYVPIDHNLGSQID